MNHLETLKKYDNFENLNIVELSKIYAYSLKKTICLHFGEVSKIVEVDEGIEITTRDTTETEHGPIYRNIETMIVPLETLDNFRNQVLKLLTLLQFYDDSKESGLISDEKTIPPLVKTHYEMYLLGLV